MSSPVSFFEQIALDAGALREPQTTMTTDAPPGDGVLRIATFDLGDTQLVGEGQPMASPWSDLPIEEVGSPIAAHVVLERVAEAAEVARFDASGAPTSGRFFPGTDAAVPARRSSPDARDAGQPHGQAARGQVWEDEPGEVGGPLRGGGPVRSAPASTWAETQVAEDVYAAAPNAGRPRRTATPPAMPPVTPLLPAADEGVRELAPLEHDATPPQVEPISGARPTAPLAAAPASLAPRSDAPNGGATPAAEKGLLASPVPASLRPTSGSPGLTVQRAIAPSIAQLQLSSSSRVMVAPAPPGVSAAFASPVSTTNPGFVTSTAPPQRVRVAGLDSSSLPAETLAAGPSRFVADRAAPAPHEEAVTPDSPSLVRTAAMRPPNGFTPLRVGDRPEAVELPSAPRQARPLTAPSPPKLVIGRLDIIVESPVASERAAPPQPPAFPDASSALYLRRL